MGNEKFWKQHYGKVVGKTVAKVVMDAADHGVGEIYGLMFTDGTVAWILCDPEGNGPGFLEI